MGWLPSHHEEIPYRPLGINIGCCGRTAVLTIPHTIGHLLVGPGDTGKRWGFDSDAFEFDELALGNLEPRSE